MAKETALALWIGTDHIFEMTVKNAAETALVDCATWAMSFMLKESKDDADAAAVLTLTTTLGDITVSGSYAGGTQVVNVAVADEDTSAFDPRTVHWELKRTDAGFEAVLGYGPMRLRRAVHRA